MGSTPHGSVYPATLSAILYQQLVGPSLNKKNQTFLLVVVPQFNHSPLFSLCFYRFYTWQVKQNNAKSSHRLLTHPFFSEQFNDFNGALFNIRTRSLNNFCYWLSQIVGSLAIGLLLDQRRLTRRARAFLGWSVLLMMVFAVHTWAYFYQRYVFSSWKEEIILISFLESIPAKRLRLILMIRWIFKIQVTHLDYACISYVVRYPPNTR